MELMKSESIVQDRQPQPQEEEEIMQQEEEEEQRFHVLAVDDSVIDRKLLEKLLKASSYQVTCVESGEKALEYLGLLHHSSPAASSSQHHHQGSSWKDVPVVVMSSENVPSRISMCLEGGAEEFMLKPLQVSDLHKIQAHLLKSLPHS
ncbi:hypothetical protein Goshw_024078 [Gossypium schwendimanii]|uniref:Response regulatory domain-containing protein n=1 Tax=Gossypium schwendimanii TaxID=34291 RepID=A0A7J9M8M1_GOSSC|nr:hypothetical protein [Gossypium schwendimanii]